MPISPDHRSLDKESSYTHNISVGNSLITLLTTTSPNRYESISFTSSLSSTYTSSLTLGEMIVRWYSVDTAGELVGNICSTHIQCDSVCSDEVISSPKLVYSSDSYLFNCLILGGFVLFVLVVLMTTISILVDFINWTAIATTQIKPLDEGNPSESLLNLAYSLIEAIITESEKCKATEPVVGDGVIYRTHDDKYDIEVIRNVMYEKYGKNTFIRHMVVSESSENNK